MAKTNTVKTIASGPAPKAKKKKLSEKIQDKIEIYENKIAQIDDVILNELNEPVDTFTVRKSWLVVAAIIVTVVAIAFIF